MQYLAFKTGLSESVLIEDLLYEKLKEKRCNGNDMVVQSKGNLERRGLLAARAEGTFLAHTRCFFACMVL